MVRYSQGADGAPHSETVGETLSRYGVRKTFRQLPRTISISEKVIFVMSSGAEIARAANLTYHGGPLSILLGSYGMRTCPDIFSEEGSQKFKIYNDLEGIVLGGEAMP
jgi:hypothetical protein